MSEILIDGNTNTISTGTGGLQLDPAATEIVSVGGKGLKLPDGTAAEPSIAFSDDINTGVFSPSNDVVSITAQGLEAMRVTGVVSSVNYLDISPSATGNALSVTATGTDTDIDINLVPKGAGVLKSGGTAVSLSTHNHSGVYEPADATILKDADIGVTVQAYDATYVVDADIGSTVQAYNANTRTLKDNLAASTAPTATDDSGSGYAVGSIWIDTTLDKSYICADATSTAAVWNQIDAAGGSSAPIAFYPDPVGTSPSVSTGTRELAIGDSAVVASGTEAIAIGNAYASGNYTTAINVGFNTSSYGAKAAGSVAIGYGTIADQSNSIAIGFGAKAQGGSGSIGIGSGAQGGSDGIAVGSNANATGSYHQNTAFGYASNATGGTGANTAVAIGANADARGTGNIAIGKSSTTYSNNYSIVIGYQATNYTGTSSHGASAIGPYAKAVNPSEWAIGSGYYSTQGDCIALRYFLRTQTTDATQTEMLASATSGAGTARAKIPSDTTYLFTANIVARRTDADNESAGYKIEGVIDNNAGTTALVGSITKTVIAEDTAAWDVTAEADDTNDALAIKVTGEGSKTIKWFCELQIQKVNG